MSERCPFCEPDRERVLYEDSLVAVLRDGFPVSPGHALVIPRRHYEDPFLRPLLDLLEDPAFREAVGALPGYSLEPMGRIIAS